MSEKLTPRQLMQQFCDEWNALSLSPALHPVIMVHESFANKVVASQLEGRQGNIRLPEDPHNPEEVRDWLQVASNEGLSDFSTIPLQLLVVDAKRRMAVFDLDISSARDGYTDIFSHIKVIAPLREMSRRKTWIDPKDLPRYRSHLDGERSDRAGVSAKEEVERFQRALKAMVREKIKDVETGLALRQQKEKQTELVQELFNGLKDHGLPVKALVDDKRLRVDMDGGMGQVVFADKALSCALRTDASAIERRAFADLIKAVSV